MKGKINVAIINKQDYELFEHLVKLNQNQMRRSMAQLLRSKYSQVIETQDYILAMGEIPIALVAHMDTVFKHPVQTLYYDSHKTTFWSPDGLGADDRAGIFAILQVLKAGLRPSVILTTDEEIGGFGASALTMDYPTCPIPGLKYLIELDRCGSKDAVFYCCASDDFKEYITEFGFIEARGSFSDISILMPNWQICGVNLSIGYMNEHMHIETLDVSALMATVEKVKTMLQVRDIPHFEFIEQLQSRLSAWGDIAFDVKCGSCNKVFQDYEAIPVKALSGGTKFFCPDCVAGRVEWCIRCQEAFEITPGTDYKLCQDCRGIVNGISNN